MHWLNKTNQIQVAFSIRVFNQLIISKWLPVLIIEFFIFVVRGTGRANPEAVPRLAISRLGYDVASLSQLSLIQVWIVFPCHTFFVEYSVGHSDTMPFDLA